VTFKVDAFRKETFRGVVSQVAHECDHGANVVTYDTIVGVRQSRPEIISGDDGLRDDSGGHGSECSEAPQHGAAVQTSNVS